MEHTHYIVVIDWATNDDTDSSIVGIRHTKDEALELFRETVEEEKKFAIENNWEILEDRDNYFHAGEEGYYAAAHTVVWVEEVM